MNVLLVNPTRERLFSHSSLGLLYVAGSLKAAGHSVNYVEGSGIELYRKLIAISPWPEVIGITVMSPMVKEVLNIANFMKNKEGFRKGITIVAGGPHATIDPGSLLDPGDIDFCVIGEGEKTFAELLSCYSLFDVHGLAWKENGKIIFSAPRAPEANLDQLPFPARELLDKEYFSRHSVSIMASRGCPYNCYFCQPTLRKMFGSKVRWRSYLNVLEEMGKVMYQFKVKHFEFFDDTFTANKDFVYELSDGLALWRMLGEEWAASWEILTRVNAVDHDILSAMKAGGLTRITFGVESGSQAILDYYRKGITVDQIINAFKLCKQIGIKTHALFMVGAPMETKETLKATENLIKKIKPDSIFVSITTPLPGTGMAQDQGELVDLSEINYYSRPLMKLKYLEPEEVIAARKNLLRKFYGKKLLDPRFAWSFLHQRSWSYVKTVIKNIGA